MGGPTRAPSSGALPRIRCPRDGVNRTVDDVERATLSWVHWWNTTRLHSGIGHLPPAEFESTHYAHPQPAVLAGDH